MSVLLHGRNCLYSVALSQRQLNSQPTAPIANLESRKNVERTRSQLFSFTEDMIFTLWSNNTDYLLAFAVEVTSSGSERWRNGLRCHIQDYTVIKG